MKMGLLAGTISIRARIVKCRPVGFWIPGCPLIPTSIRRVAPVSCESLFI